MTNTSNRNYPTTKTCRQSNQHISPSSNISQVIAIGSDADCSRIGDHIKALGHRRLTYTSVFISWIHLYLTGKNVIRPGNYIRQLLEAPEKSYQPIHQYSTSTLRDAFSLRVGPVPGVSIHAYTPISIIARTTMYAHDINFFLFLCLPFFFN